MSAANRLLYFLHRWGGVALCILFAMWFVTGVMLMYVGFPKLTQAERLSFIGDITAENCCIPLADALKNPAFATPPNSIQALVVAERPIYRLGFDKTYHRIDARTGELLPDVSPEEALSIAASYFPGAKGRHDGLIIEDNWTYTMRFAAHRPIHRIYMDDPARTLIYISSKTGEVVRDAPLQQRQWAYVSAWLHWLYMFKFNYDDPQWRLIMSVVCIVSILLVITGVWIGVARWKFVGRYKSGRKTPYVQPMHRWHHIGGLLFAFFTLTWLLSGLASINPLHMFDRKALEDRAAYQGGALTLDRFGLDASAALARLGPSFKPRLLDWVSIGGAPYVIATDARNQTRVLPAGDGSAGVLTRVPEASIRRALKNLVPNGDLAKIEVLTAYDSQYYARAQHTLRGDESRRLPVLRATYTDPARSTVYVDAYTGEIVMHHDRATRMFRWLFNFMHSWEFNSLLATRPSWDVIMLALSVGGFVISITGLVLGFRRIKFAVDKGQPKRKAPASKRGAPAPGGGGAAGER